jgi:hypothetical protein
MPVQDLFIAVASTVPADGPGRFGANVGIVVGLVAVVLGGLGRWRAGTGAGRLGLVAAVPIGLAGTALGAVHLARTSGAGQGLGTGNGRAGAVVAVVFGLAGVVLGGLAWARQARGQVRASQPGTVSPHS